MAKKVEKVEEEAGEGAPMWYMSFADMVTQLLAFFVAMAVFSSFDDNSLKKIGGVFQYLANYSIFGSSKQRRHSFVPPENRIITSEKGSETPTASDAASTENPMSLPYVADSEAFKDCKIIRVPCERLFWGPGDVLKEDARGGFLQPLSKFLNLTACQVIVGQAGPAYSDDQGLRRSLAVISYLNKDGGVPQQRFGVSLSSTATAEAGGQQAIEIVIMKRDICK